MLKLSTAGIEDRRAWEEKGYQLPAYSREKMEKATKENPLWVHFGAGNIFRAFQAKDAQRLLDQGILDRGVTVAEGFDYEIIEKQYRPHDNLSILVTLKGEGTIEKTVVGSIGESCILDSGNEREYSRLKEIFAADSLQLASFTITEKGYSLVNDRGEQLKEVAEDLEAGPHSPKSYMGKVVSLLYARFLAGKKPIAMVSMDNCSHNGDKLKEAVLAFARAWGERGLAKREFLDYVKDRKKVSFPWSMIDKITPRPDPSIEEILKKDGVEDLEPVITSKNTYVAPFVNAEQTQYLVVEDWFPAGRPPLEKAGVYFTDRETVDRVEKMKVCTCLNPLHTALAVFGCLLGYTRISEEMKNKDLKSLVELIGYGEGLPVVVNPGILDPREFLDTVLRERIPNPFMPDTPQRIATDTSQKLAIRFGETIKAYGADPTLDPGALKGIPLVLAAWIRYLMGVDDAGKAFALSPDPLLDSLVPAVSRLSLGKEEGAGETAAPILENQAIFGVDLKKAGLQAKVIEYLKEMLRGPGAVDQTLKKVVSQ